MKVKNYLYFALTSVALMLSSCAEDTIINNGQAVPKHTGDEIYFGSSAAYNIEGERETNTRTEYGGFIEGATVEPVYWVEGDDVRVYCPEGAIKMSDYDVNVTGDKVVTTSLARRGNTSLQWGDTKKAHTFYSVYPAPAEESTDLDGNTKLIGTVPAMQQYASYKKDGYNHIFTPDMKYAYMVAKTVVPNPNNIGESVILKYSPIATAVEISLQNNTGRLLTLNSVYCASEKAAIAGSFEADLSSITVAEEGAMHYGNGYPTTSVIGTGSNQIQIPLLTNDEGTRLLIGESVTFTVFMLPTADITDLKLVIEAVEGDVTGYKTGTFSGITIKQQKKTYLRNISVSSKPFTQADWIKYIDNETKLTALSIPAAGGAASGYKNGNAYYVNDTLRQQNYDIPSLWNMGIRCFEFALDINTEDASLLGQKELISGGASTGVKLGEAAEAVVNQLVSHPDEFAMIILTYQETEGWGTNRNPASFMTQVNIFWGKLREGLNARSSKCKTALYDPTKTVGDVRGNLFCIARPTSIYQDYGRVQSTSTSGSSPYLKNVTLTSLGVPTPDQDIMVIHGWGSLKDKWQQRGFAHRSVRKTNTSSSDPDDASRPGRPFDVSTMRIDRQATGISLSGITYEYKLQGDIPVTTNYTITPGNLAPDFSYDVQNSLSTTTAGAWVQEWARVSNMEQVYWFEFTGGATYESMNSGSHTKAEYDAGHSAKTVYWAPSKAEKYARIEETLTKAITRAANDNKVYINSLCGYYVDPHVYSSFNPCGLTDRNISNSNKALTAELSNAGMAGNIHEFAHETNDYFNKLLQDKTYNNKVGPMGIIMMDRVGESEASIRIPQIIISNNFQFELSNENPLLKIHVLDKFADGDAVAAPQRREASKQGAEEMSIVWE